MIFFFFSDLEKKILLIVELGVIKRFLGDETHPKLQLTF